jgi:hypothetical protein
LFKRGGEVPAGTVERGERKRTATEVSKADGDPCSGISSADPKTVPSDIRHVGGTKLDQALVRNVRTYNLHGDAKGKGTSGANREAKSTDAPVRG